MDYYNYAWTEDPIVAGSILESGTAMGFGNKLPESANHSWYMTAQKAGCDTSQDPDSILSCMRGKSMSELLQAESAGGGLASILGNFTPTIDNRTVFYNYTERGLAKQFVQAPMLIGNNYFEAGLFQLFAIGMNITEEQWLELDAGSFNCPSSTSAEYRVMAGLPVWRYIYNGIVGIPFDVILLFDANHLQSFLISNFPSTLTQHTTVPRSYHCSVLLRL